eukprot:1108676-Pyramimonas_sp.AAC.1
MLFSERAAVRCKLYAMVLMTLLRRRSSPAEIPSPSGPWGASRRGDADGKGASLDRGKLGSIGERCSLSQTVYGPGGQNYPAARGAPNKLRTPRVSLLARKLHRISSATLSQSFGAPSRARASPPRGGPPRVQTWPMWAPHCHPPPAAHRHPRNNDEQRRTPRRR